jgi:hypothetical protein
MVHSVASVDSGKEDAAGGYILRHELLKRIAKD